jgi:hypothetical protein
MSPLLLELPQLAVMNPPTAATAKAKNICRIRASGECYNDAPFILCAADHVKEKAPALRIKVRILAN